MWNSLDLRCPINDLSEYSDKDKHVVNELRDFVTVLSTSANTLTSDNPVWKDLQDLRDIQERYKRMLQCDKCLFFLQRTGHCLKKMVLLKLSKSYLDLAERFLFGFQDSPNSLYLPSQQQVEFILVQTQIAAKLVSEAIKYSTDTFCHLVQLLNVQHLVPELIRAASITAKFNMMLKVTLKQICSLYLDVFPWRLKLKRGTHNWPERMDLPQDLEKWLERFNSGLLKPFRMSKTDFDILSSVLNVEVGTDEGDLDCIIVFDTKNKNDSVTDPSSSSAQVSKVTHKKRKKISNSLRNLAN